MLPAYLGITQASQINNGGLDAPWATCPTTNNFKGALTGCSSMGNHN